MDKFRTIYKLILLYPSTIRTISHSLVILLLACITNYMMVAKAQAELVTYQFNGTCRPGSDGDCAFYGLSDGDPVPGSITLDNQSLSYSQFTDILPSDPDLDFYFTFGNLSFNKSNLAPDAIRIKYRDPGGSELEFQNPWFACINAVVPCYGLQDGSHLLVLRTTFVTITSFLPDNLIKDAVADGSWSIVPIPTALWLFGSGLLGLFGIARRKKAV